MKDLEAEYHGFAVFNAGLPHFPRNFSRDGLERELILLGLDVSDIPVPNYRLNFLINQLCLCAFLQARENDAQNGAERGKIHHEHPGMLNEDRGKWTDYNACDTTALWLICHGLYWRLTDSRDMINGQRESIEMAVDYILAHVKDDLFVDGPGFCGADELALDVTYWKDSIMSGRSQGKPAYDVTYTLAHVINLRGLLDAALILDSKELDAVAEKMLDALWSNLWDEELGCFYIAQDRQGSIQGKSSDSLHSLSYLRPEHVPLGITERIVQSSESLETSLGYRTLDPELAKELEGSIQVQATPQFQGVNVKSGVGYHARTVWPWEQAKIHRAARRHNLFRAAAVSARIAPWLGDNKAPELYLLGDDGSIEEDGCNPQLWTRAAAEYFKTALA